MSDSLRPRGLQPSRLLHPWDSPGKNTGVGCHFLLQGIFLIQGSNPGLPHCRQTLNPLSHQGWKHFTEWQKILANDKSDKAWIPKIYKKYSHNSTTKSDLKVGRGAEQTFFQKTVSQQTHEKMFRSLVIREMQIKTTIRYYLLPVRVTIIKKERNNKY